MARVHTFLNDVSLKRKLIVIYLLISIVPIMSLGFYLTNRLYTTTLEHDLSLTRSSHAQLQDNVTGMLRSYVGVLNGLLGDSRVMKYVDYAYEDEAEAIYDFRMFINPILRRIQLDSSSVFIRVYSDNFSIAHSEEMSNSLTDLMEEDWYLNKPENKESGTAWATSLRINDANPNQYIGCYRELVDNVTGQVNRVFSVFFTEAELYSLIDKERESGKMIFLIDPNGFIITSTQREWVFRSVSEFSETTGDHLLELNSESFAQVNGQKYTVIRTNINQPNIAAQGWDLLSLIPAETVDASVSRIWGGSLLLSLLSFLLCMVPVFWISNNISKRAESLIGKMKQAVTDNYELEVPVSGMDEIGTIETQFSGLVGKTRALIHEVLLANLRVKDAELNMQKMLTEKSEAELIALQEQINPHYLFNTLETIRMNLIIAGDRKNAEIISLFAESFRMVMDRAREFHTLGEELAFVDVYFRIQEYRSRGSIEMQIDVPDIFRSIQIPKLIMQPLVENAIYHGLEMKGEPGWVRVRAYLDADVLVMQVSDNGIGISELELIALRKSLHKPASLSLSGHRRIALRNIQQRIQLQYGEPFGLTIDSRLNGGTDVLVRIPYAVLGNRGEVHVPMPNS